MLKTGFAKNALYTFCTYVQVRYKNIRISANTVRPDITSGKITESDLV